MADSSQKFIARNRAPRVQIEYDVELYGAEKKVQLPFVMGVMSDLVGQSRVAQPTVADRKFLEIDVDNFDERMKALAPRAAFSVPNTLTGEGNLAVDLTFESMADFSPGAIAAKVDALRPLLEARTQLQNLMAYMDGKTGAETLIETILNDPSLLAAVSAPTADGDTAAALDSLRNLDLPSAEDDTSGDVLAGLAAQMPEQAAPADDTADVLSGLAAAAPAQLEQTDTTDEALAALAAIEVEEPEPGQQAGNILDALSTSTPEDAEETDLSADVLAGLSSAAPAEEDTADTTDEALAALAAIEVEETEPDQQAGNILDALSTSAPEDAEDTDQSADVLAGLSSVAPAEEDATDALGDALSSLTDVDLPDAEADDDHHAGVLESLAELEPEEGEAESVSQVVLDDLAQAEIADAPEGDDVSAVLDALPDVAEPDAEVSDDMDVLEGLQSDEPAEEPEGEDDLTALLGALDAPDKAAAEDSSADVLAELAVASAAEGSDAGEDLDDILSALEPAEEDTADEGGDLDAVSDMLEPAEEAEPDQDSADVLADLTVDDPVEAPDEDDDLTALLGALDAPDEGGAEDSSVDVLAELAVTSDAEGSDAGEDLDDILGALEPAEKDTADDGGDLDAVSDMLEPAEEAEPDQDSADVLADLTVDDPADVADEDDDLTALLGGLDAPEEGEAEDSSVDVLAELAVTSDAEGSDAGEDLDDILGALEPAEEDTADEGHDLDAVSDMLEPAEEVEPDQDSADVLADLTVENPVEAPDEDDDLTALLGGLDAPDEGEAEDSSADVLAELAVTSDAEGSDVGNDDLAGLLDDLGAEGTTEPESAEDDLDALLGDLNADDGSDLDDLLQDLDDTADDGDLDDLLADLGDDADPETAESAADDDLDALMAGLSMDDAASDDDADLDLDDLLGDLEAGTSGDDGGDTDDLDSLLGDLGGEDDTPAAAALEEPELAYGTMSAGRPEPQKLERKRFRLAVLGDFSGRASKGQLETGDALAARKAILLDPDTVDEVIESFATELVLPIGKDGAGISVKLDDLDGLHPDELYENVELFSELVNLRKQLQSGATADHAAAMLGSWAEKYGTKARAPKRSSAGNAMPADKRLSAFQQLIGDSGNTLREASPVEDLLARVVGPHIRALPDPDVAAMQTAVDAALSDAMRLVLHHPEFQSIEAQWRSLDLLARSIEDDDTLDVMLYDISAEELAADLAAQEDLSSTGFVRLLTEEPLDEENGRGGYSALIGLYQFEETPPHAELLGRIARVAAHVDAPFFAAVSPEFLKTPKPERPKLVAEAWDTLQGMAEAGHLGLVSPRFLLRRPYGAKTDPCYEFEFEEFTESEGLRGMLWANPVVLVAILLARSFKQFGASMQLGKVMTLGEMPYHYVTDRFGDQVALPCTERNIDLDKIALAQERGFMAVSAVKGRDEVRLTSFNSLKGGEILGPWTGLPAPEPSPPDPRGLPKPPVAEAESDDDDDLDLDDLGLDLGDDDDGDLDALLSSFGDDDDADDSGDDGMDAELAALLDDL